MKKKTPKNVFILINVNVFFMFLSLIIKGDTAIIMVPILFVLNLIMAIYASSNKDKNLKTAAIILIFVAPIIGFSVCVSVL